MRFVNLRSWLWPLVAAICVFGALAWGGSRWATARARDIAASDAMQTARLHNGLLASEMQKFRLLPIALAEYPAVAAALESPDPPTEKRANIQLEQLAQRTDAAAIYLIDSSGKTRVASNWRLPTSFVGQNYGFRPYFRDAMARGSSELFALGTVSGRPGLYLARRIDREGRKLGVIVVKVEFDRVEADWSHAPGMTFVTDPHGVVLVTSVPSWRFGATRPLDAATLADARRTLQFGNAPPRQLPIDLGRRTAIVREGQDEHSYRVASLPAPVAGAHLVHLSPMSPPLAAARSTAISWSLVGALLLLGGGAAAFRQNEKQRLLRESRESLEHEVEKRTAELREANARFQLAREELARANRLGTLGQITAGVAHEINQPLAAIRAFAENGQVLLDRSAIGDVRENLSRIVSLTDRVGTITAELRNFARRKTPSPVQSDLGSVFDGAMLLLGEAAAGVVTIEASRAQRARRLLGDRIRLEQVLVNLIRNALDAVDGLPRAAIRVSAQDTEDGIAVVVSDNGPGVDPAIRERLFDPFETAKPGGLGLGLAIARDIAREFGGELVLSQCDLGARFVLTLKAAG